MRFLIDLSGMRSKLRDSSKHDSLLIGMSGEGANPGRKGQQEAIFQKPLDQRGREPKPATDRVVPNGFFGEAVGNPRPDTEA